jgi:hypothetical protein
MFARGSQSRESIYSKNYIPSDNKKDEMAGNQLQSNLHIGKIT